MNRLIILRLSHHRNLPSSLLPCLHRYLPVILRPSPPGSRHHDRHDSLRPNRQVVPVVSRHLDHRGNPPLSRPLALAVNLPLNLRECLLAYHRCNRVNSLCRHLHQFQLRNLRFLLAHSRRLNRLGAQQSSRRLGHRGSQLGNRLQNQVGSPLPGLRGSHLVSLLPALLCYLALNLLAAQRLSRAWSQLCNQP